MVEKKETRGRKKLDTIPINVRVTRTLLNMIRARMKETGHANMQEFIRARLSEECRR